MCVRCRCAHAASNLPPSRHRLLTPSRAVAVQALAHVPEKGLPAGGSVDGQCNGYLHIEAAAATAAVAAHLRSELSAWGVAIHSEAHVPIAGAATAAAAMAAAAAGADCALYTPFGDGSIAPSRLLLPGTFRADFVSTCQTPAGLSWSSAATQDLVYSAAAACEHFGISPPALHYLCAREVRLHDELRRQAANSEAGALALAQHLAQLHALPAANRTSH